MVKQILHKIVMFIVYSLACYGGMWWYFLSTTHSDSILAQLHDFSLDERTLFLNSTYQIALFGGAIIMVIEYAIRNLWLKRCK